MNNLKTTVNVTCSESNKALPYNGIVVGKLGTRVMKSNGIEVGFKYEKEDGALLLSGSAVYSWEEANTLWDTVKGSIPVDATFEETMDIAFLMAFKMEMASTFGIEVSEIEEVA